MLKRDNLTKVLAEFFKLNPANKTGLQLREIARRVGFAPTSVKNYLNDLEEEGVVIRRKHQENGYQAYHPNHENEYFKYLRSLHLLREIQEIGLIKHISEECKPEAIIISGIRMSEEGEISQVRIIIKSQEKSLKLQNYEETIGIKLVPVFITNLNDISQELGEEIMNGIVVKGQIRLEKIEEQEPIKTLTEKEYLRMVEEEHAKIEKPTLQQAQTEKGQEEEGFYTRILKDI